MKIKKIFTNWKVLLLIVFLVLAIVAIHPASSRADHLAIRGVVKNSAAQESGIVTTPTSTPTSKELLLELNGKKITTLDDYYEFQSTLQINDTVRVKTEASLYKLIVQPETETITLNETEEYFVPEVVEEEILLEDNTTKLVNKTINRTETRNKTITNVVGVEDLGLVLFPAPTSNLKKGLDLAGGTRVVLKPEEEVPPEDMEILLANMKERLNVFGLSDVVIRLASDLAGEEFILIEIAGANREEVNELLAKQGKFEAKIGEATVFRGGQDITYVCRSADCSGLDPQRGCSKIQDGYVCAFRFSIALTPEAAKKQADVTSVLEVIADDNGESYLSQKLALVLDDEQVDELSIGADLKGRAVTEIAISGSGSGLNQQEAVFDALKNMKRLQTILITGSLPVKLSIVKTDAISPVLGEEFLSNVWKIGLYAIIAVALVIFIRYRRFAISIPMIITMLSEITLLLGLASLVGWNLDLAAIAGIIIAIGVGVDHQIVISDEVLGKSKRDDVTSWKQRIKSAFFIIMGTYLTTLVAMLPLLFAGAGLLKGFAFTTIAGITFGVFITRPAFAAMVEILVKK
jgi:preprotein translocase subunit SecD